MSQLTVEHWQKTKAGAADPTAERGGQPSLLQGLLRPAHTRLPTRRATPSKPLAKNLERSTKKALAKTWGVHVTVTVPEELRHVLRTNQQDGYALLMKAAAQAIIDIARDPRFVGGTVGVLAVLHTWTQQLHYHPHVHCLVTGGGVTIGLISDAIANQRTSAAAVSEVADRG